jgi:hypothetical protein
MGNINHASFFSSLARLPQCKPTETFECVLDHLQADKSPRATELLSRKGFTVRYLPLYSRDLNPVETVWRDLKTQLRGHQTFAEITKSSTRLMRSRL